MEQNRQERKVQRDKFFQVVFSALMHVVLSALMLATLIAPLFYRGDSAFLVSGPPVGFSWEDGGGYALSVQQQRVDSLVSAILSKAATAERLGATATALVENKPVDSFAYGEFMLLAHQEDAADKRRQRVPAVFDFFRTSFRRAGTCLSSAKDVTVRVMRALSGKATPTNLQPEAGTERAFFKESTGIYYNLLPGPVSVEVPRQQSNLAIIEAVKTAHMRVVSTRKLADFAAEEVTRRQRELGAAAASTALFMQHLYQKYGISVDKQMPSPTNLHLVVAPVFSHVGRDALVHMRKTCHLIECVAYTCCIRCFEYVFTFLGCAFRWT